MPGFTLSELQARLGGEARGGDPTLSGVASLDQAQADQLSFVVNPKFAKAARASRAGALIVPPTLAEGFDQPCLVVANPHANFARAIALFHPEPASPTGIDPSARIDASSQVDPSASIGPNVVIGPGAEIGARTRIEAGCAIGAAVRIGADGHLYPNVTVYQGCRLGDRVIVHAGTVIGSDGFGLAWEDGRWLKVPQVGRVLIGNDVEIGANTTIDRGALDDTVIEDGVKIDNLVQIAHNCRIGENTAIAGCAGLAGSTTIGRNCLIGGAAMILGHIEIGDRVTVSGASFIGKSIREAGVYTSTQPQMPHDEWLKNAAQLRHLADMRDRIRALERQLGEGRDRESDVSADR
jgi:UDP-3-O-[3-hydroxymyristoyl] glucosamine N-acyltransferase